MTKLPRIRHCEWNVAVSAKAKALGYYMGRTAGSGTWGDGVSCLYPKAKALGYYMGRTAGSGTWGDGVSCLYPIAKALGYYMGRTSGSGTWREGPVGMAYIVTMDFSPLVEINV